MFQPQNDDNATQCRYPARTRWLKQQLHIKTLPYAECKEYNTLIKKLDPKSVTIVYPSAHINSPASMYGHTFLRINSSFNSRLLAYAINYAAAADPSKTNAIVFSINGLFGGYYGRYSLLPYTEKLKEYRDGENRDIWEYDLNFSEKETRAMVEHIWEIKDTKTTYYFFNKNCSYEVLWLLEIARPSLHLREHFFYQVIPFETIHVAKEEGIIQNTHYRPSKRNRIEAYKKVLNIKEISYAKKLYQDKLSLDKFLQNPTLSKEKKSYILDVAIELLQYYYQKHQIEKKIYLHRFHQLTVARATLGKAKKINPSFPPNPLQRHKANRFRLGFGKINTNETIFVGYRPAYHSLEDSSYGFLQGTQIEFFNIQAYFSQNDLKLDTATLISIKSIAPIDPFFRPISWKLSIGWDRNSLEDKSKFNATFGVGSSLANEYGYAYLTTDVVAYDNNIANFAIGFSVGAVLDKYQSFMNTLVEYMFRYYETKTKQNILQISQNFRISQNLSLLFQYNYKEYQNFMLHQHDQQKYFFALEYYY